MRSWALAWVSLFPAFPVHAEGLRSIDIGEPCAAAIEKELARGSQPTRSLSEIPMQAVDLVGFSGSHDGHEALLSFRCVDGLVASQLIVAKLATEAEAQAVFDQQYQALRDRFGPPCTDWRKLPLWYRLTLWLRGAYHVDHLTNVVWNLGDDLEASLDSMPAGPGPDYWAVSVSVLRRIVTIVREPDGTERRVDDPVVCLHGE